MELEVPYNLSENFYHADGKVKKFFGKIGNVFMQGTFAPTRAAFLAIVRFNPLGIASRFAAGFINDPDFKPEVVAKATPRWEKFKVTWRKLGGAVSRLEKQVKLEYKKRPIQRVEDAIKKLLAQKSSFDGGYNNLTGGEEALIIKSAITALPAIILAIKSQKGIGNPFKQGTGPQDIDIEPTVVAEDVIKTDPSGNPTDPSGNPIGEDKIWGMPKPVVYVGAFLGFAGLITAAIFGIKKYQSKSK